MDPAFIIKPALSVVVAGALQALDVKARLEQLNQFPAGNTPEEFASFLQENMARLAKVAREANVKLD